MSPDTQTIVAAVLIAGAAVVLVLGAILHAVLRIAHETEQEKLPYPKDNR